MFSFKLILFGTNIQKQLIFSVFIATYSLKKKILEKPVLEIDNTSFQWFSNLYTLSQITVLSVIDLDNQESRWVSN